MHRRCQVLGGSGELFAFTLRSFGSSRVRARGFGAEYFGVALASVNDGIERRPRERNKIGVEKPRCRVRLRITFGVKTD